jgi:hypothetical protein
MIAEMAKLYEFEMTLTMTSERKGGEKGEGMLLKVARDKL